MHSGFDAFLIDDIKLRRFARLGYHHLSNVLLQNLELTAFFDVPLRDLGEDDPAFAGILAPGADAAAAKVGITAQFLEHAESYDVRYANTEHFLGLFRQALGEFGPPPPEPLAILDIGAGSGSNTVDPCLALFPECRVIATDLSPNLLRILQRYVVERRLQHRVACVCMDAMDDPFRPGTFDLVVGAAILHHLLDPTRALASVYRALKPGGTAVFFEPFEGVALLRLAFEFILERAESEPQPLAPGAVTLLKAMVLDYATRAGSDKSAEHFRHMDDKWLFTRHWLTGAAQAAGFCKLAILPHAFHPTLFRDFTTVLLRLGAGLEASALPDWAWDILSRFDRSLSTDMKRDVLVEGTIVLRRP